MPTSRYIDKHNPTPARQLLRYVGFPAVAIAGLMWGQFDIDHPLRLAALAAGVAAVAFIWWDIIGGYIKGWREGGMEHHAIERAGLLTTAISLVAFLGYGVFLHATGRSNPDPLNYASFVVLVFLWSESATRSRLS